MSDISIYDQYSKALSNLSPKRLGIFQDFETTLDETQHIYFMHLMIWLSSDESRESKLIKDGYPKVKRQSRQHRQPKFNSSNLLIRFINAHEALIDDKVEVSKMLRGLVIHLKNIEEMTPETPLPALVQKLDREPGRLTPKVFKHYISTYSQLEAALTESLKSGHCSADIIKGQIVLSAALYGGLISIEGLYALIFNAPKGPISIRNQSAWSLDLTLNGYYYAEPRVWYPDLLTETLLLNKKLETLEKSTGNKKDMAKKISSFVQALLSNLPKDVHQSLSLKRQKFEKYLDIMAVGYDIYIPPFITRYAQGGLVSHSLKSSALSRIAGHQIQLDLESAFDSNWAPTDQDLKYTTKETSSNICSEISEESQAQNWSWIKGKIIHDNSTDQLAKSLESLMNSKDSKMSHIQKLVIMWGITLSKNGSSSFVNLRPGRIKTMISSIGSRLCPLMQERDITLYYAEELEGLYEDLLGTVSSQSLKRKLANILARFQSYLEREHYVDEIDSREVFGVQNSPIPVDANIILIDEYHHILTTLEDISELELAPDLNIVVRLIFILGYRCGLRRSEGLKLRLDDIQGDDDLYLLIRPQKDRTLKTNNAKRVFKLDQFLDENELVLLKSWLQKRRDAYDHKESNSPFLFYLTGNNTPCIDGDSVFPIIHSVMRAVCRDNSLRYHHLRHSFATLLLLKLMLNDKSSLSIFEAYPQTQKWIRNSEELKKHLFGTLTSTKKSLYALSMLMGHASPETTLEHYSHLLDYMARELIEERLKPTSEQLALASDQSMSTIYRWLESGKNKYRENLRKKYLNGSLKTASIPPVKAIRNFSLELTNSNLEKEFDQCRKVLFKLIQSPNKEDGLTQLSNSTGVAKSDIETWRNNLYALLGTDPHKFGMSSAKKINLEIYNGETLPLPAQPRKTVQDRAAYLSLLTSLDEMYKHQPEQLQILLSGFKLHTQKRNHLMRFTSVEVAKPIIEALSLLKSDDAALTFTLLHGKGQSHSNIIRECIPNWRMGLGISKKESFETTIASNDTKAGEHGWLGINLVNRRTGKAIEGARYVFAMLFILSL